MDQNIPLETATQHFAYAAKRGQDSGRLLEHQRIIKILKQTGHYDAVLAIKKHDEKESRSECREHHQ